MRRTQWLTMVAAAACGLLSAPASASTRPIIELLTSNVGPSDPASLGVITPARSSRCTLGARSSRTAATHRYTATPGAARHLLWNWRVGRHATPGTWRLHVRCRAAGHWRSTTASVVVRGHRGHGPLISAHTLRLKISRSSQLGGPADTGGEVNTSGEGAAGNPFDWGQCTYYAYERRGDIVESAAATGIPRGGAVPGEWIAALNRNAWMWDAYRWTANAQRAGLPTGTNPVAGAVVVFPKGYGDSPVGHVAYVESVGANGSYTVTERNWNKNLNITRRLVAASTGVTFIYGGAAGNGRQPDQQPQPPATPTVHWTAPAPGSALSGTVHLTAEAANTSALKFSAYYATDPNNVATVGWHALGTDTTPADGFSLDWNTTTIPDQSNAGWGTVNLAVIAMVGNTESAARDYRVVSVSNHGAAVITPPPPPPPPNRTAAISYDRMAPGAPYHGYFNVAWQPFTVQSNTITQLAATVGTPGAAAGVAVPYNLTLRLCTTSSCSQVLAEANPQIVNYGATVADIGDVAVSPGQTYYIVWYQPAAANGSTWVTYWWAGGSTIASSDQMQAFVRGYNR